MQTPTGEALTLFDKLWRSHLVDETSDGEALLYIDRHLVYEVTSPQAFEGLRQAGRRPWRPSTVLAVPDHNVPTVAAHRSHLDQIADPLSRLQVRQLGINCREFGITEFGLNRVEQGIIHVVGPEQGATLPGMTVVAGDSHTSTHGAFGALAFGVGTSDVEHVLATQCLAMRPMQRMLVQIEGELSAGVGPKDLILHVIGRIGTAGATGHAIEFAGSVIRAMSMEGRMTVCNMAIEAGARVGLVAVFDQTVCIDAAEVRPMVTWGTSPEMVVDIDGRVPAPADEADPVKRASLVQALAYMGLEPGTALRGIAVDKVFIGSCTNARIEDLRSAAQVVKGRQVAANVRQALVVPGSGLVKAQAELEGLDRIFLAAGFEWREPGCSMCLGMNDDRLSPGERCASTSNRNFEGRQGPGGRSHLLSPAMAASAAIAGHFTDPF